jgi:hypothetical protein
MMMGSQWLLEVVQGRYSPIFVAVYYNSISIAKVKFLCRDLIFNNTIFAGKKKKKMVIESERKFCMRRLKRGKSR